jgi:hypothetical protein
MTLIEIKHEPLTDELRELIKHLHCNWWDDNQTYYELLRADLPHRRMLLCMMTTMTTLSFIKSTYSSFGPICYAQEATCKGVWRGKGANVKNFVLCEDLQCHSTGSINLSRTLGMYSLTNSGLGYKFNWFHGFSAFWSSYVLWGSQISWSHSHKGNNEFQRTSDCFVCSLYSHKNPGTDLTVRQKLLNYNYACT